MLFVVTRLADADIANNHVADSFGTVLLVHKVAGECGCSDLGQMLVFGDGEHLLLGQAAKSYTVLQSNHVPSRFVRGYSPSQLPLAPPV